MSSNVLYHTIQKQQELYAIHHHSWDEDRYRYGLCLQNSIATSEVQGMYIDATVKSRMSGADPTLYCVVRIGGTQDAERRTAFGGGVYIERTA